MRQWGWDHRPMLNIADVNYLLLLFTSEITLLSIDKFNTDS